MCCITRKPLTYVLIATYRQEISLKQHTLIPTLCMPSNLVLVNARKLLAIGNRHHIVHIWCMITGLKLQHAKEVMYGENINQDWCINFIN
jgi:hypothetical protein